MGFFGDDSAEAQASNEVNQTEGHKAHWSHELIGGAAAYEAAKAWEDHQAANGKPADHAKAKELVAGFAGAAVDRIIETKGLDFVDQQRAKHHARQQAEEALRADY